MSFIQKTCLDSELIDEVYIYCSDEAVKPYVLPGVKFLKRPIELDGDDKNANDISFPSSLQRERALWWSTVAKS